MRTAKLLPSFPWLLLVLVGAACSDDSPSESETGTGMTGTTFSSTTGVTAGTASGTLTSGGSSSTSDGSTTTHDSTTDEGHDATSGTAQEDASASTLDDGASSTSGVPLDPFAFRDEDPSEYTQVDRVGFPGVSQMLILDHAAYNAGVPATDRDNPRRDMTSRLNELMLGANPNSPESGIADDLAREGYSPCIAPGSPDAPFAPERLCFSQFLPYLVPDLLTLDLDEPTVFPNGRTLEDPVMDFVMALLILNIDERVFGADIEDEDVDHEAHQLEDLYDIGGGVSFSTPGNDVPFNENRFFRLADPH